VNKILFFSCQEGCPDIYGRMNMNKKGTSSNQIKYPWANNIKI